MSDLAILLFISAELQENPVLFLVVSVMTLLAFFSDNSYTSMKMLCDHTLLSELSSIHRLLLTCYDCVIGPNSILQCIISEFPATCSQ